MKKALITLLTLAGIGLGSGLYLTIPEALRDEGLSMGHTCPQFKQSLGLLKEHEQNFYLILTAGVIPPQYYNSKIIGVRRTIDLPENTSGRYEIRAQGCDAIYSWYYRNALPVGGRSVYKLRPPINFANNLKAWCESDPGCDWLGEPSRAFEACVALYNVTVCRTAMTEMNRNWINKTTRQTCLNGLLHGDPPSVASLDPASTLPWPVCTLGQVGWSPLEDGEPIENALIEYSDTDLENNESDF